jgi:5-methylcytosine-specific restriction protein A
MPNLPPSQSDRWQRITDKRTNESRGSAAARGYGYKWRMARAAFIRNHPLCAHHLKRNEFVASRQVDHIVPHGGDPTLFWDQSNWQALCDACHSAKTRKSQRGDARAGDTDG